MKLKPAINAHQAIAAPPQVMHSWQYGPYEVVWGNGEVPEVRDSNGVIVFRGGRDECRAWIRSRGISA